MFEKSRKRYHNVVVEKEENEDQLSCHDFDFWHHQTGLSLPVDMLSNVKADRRKILMYQVGV
jgi:hypothetical protein